MSQNQEGVSVMYKKNWLQAEFGFEPGILQVQKTMGLVFLVALGIGITMREKNDFGLEGL